MKLVVFSDIHYAPEPPIHNGSIIDRKLTQYSVPVIKKLIEEINHSIKPDIAVNLGDLIEDFNDHDKDIENLKFIWNILKDIKTPFYSAIGNHDLRSMNTRKEVEEIMGYKNATFSINLKGYHLVFLGLTVDSQMSTQEGGIQKTRNVSKEDLEWLKSDLKENTFPCLVFTHYGIAEDEMKQNWWFEKSPNSALLQNRDEVKNIFRKDKNILAVFSGHQHWTKHMIEDEINYYVVGSLTENIKDNGIPDGVYLVVDLSEDKVDVKEYHIRL